MKRIELKNAFGPIPNDCYQTLINTARDVEEETAPVKKSMMLILVTALILMLALGTALALSSWRDAGRRVIEVQQTNGHYPDWPAEHKIALALNIAQQGYAEKSRTVQQLLDGSLPAEEAERLADEMLSAFTEKEISEITFMAIMEAAWGSFEQWTQDEQAWYSQLQIDMELQKTDHTLYVQPQGPIGEAQALAIARREIAREYGVAGDALDGYSIVTSFQVPEFAQAGDDQPYWYVEYTPPESMPDTSRLFDAFWVFIHPETGTLLEPIEKQVEERRAYEAEADMYNNDPLIQALRTFSEAHGSNFGRLSIEAKALWSDTLREKVIEKQQTFPGFFTESEMAETTFRYGLPDKLALPEARALAQAVLVERLGVKQEEVYFFSFEPDVFYDISDAKRPLWKFFFHMPSQYSSNAAFAREVKDYYGNARLPNYKVELDARTGETVAAFPLDFADLSPEDRALQY